MTVATGTRLGPYEITGALGAGGMGEVYRAYDARLKRDVALKVLPSHFAMDSDRLARFEREAQVLASLNHPHIAGGVAKGASRRRTCRASRLRWRERVGGDRGRTDADTRGRCGHRIWISLARAGVKTTRSSSGDSAMDCGEYPQQVARPHG